MEPSHTDIINRLMDENARYAAEIDRLNGINSRQSVQIIELLRLQRDHPSVLSHLHATISTLQSVIRMQSLANDNRTGEPITDEVFDCPVCMESACDTKVCFNSCSHGVCPTCYARMAQRRISTCPLCRTRISTTTTRTVIY